VLPKNPEMCPKRALPHGGLLRVKGHADLLQVAPTQQELLHQKTGIDLLEEATYAYRKVL
jgi:hypothetical protein